MTLIEQVISKHQQDRETIKAMKARHAEELRTTEEFQHKRETFLLEKGDISAFSYMTDLYINGRDGKAATEKAKESIALNQTKIEAWLLKMLSGVGEGIRTEFGTVYRTRKESISVADFDLHLKTNMLKPAVDALEAQREMLPLMTPEELVDIIYANMHVEYLTKAVRKESVLEAMGDADPKTGSRPNPPMAGVNYVAIQTVGVRRTK